MKALAFISAFLCVLLAIALAASYYSQNADDLTLQQDLQTAQLRLQTAQREVAQAREQSGALQLALDQMRMELAEAKTHHSGLQLQLAEAERNSQRQTRELSQAQQQQESLLKQHQQLKSELVRLHTAGADASTERNLLLQYRSEIAQLQQKIRELEGGGQQR